MQKVKAVKRQPVMNKGYSHAGASYTKKAFKGFNVESGSPAEDINANNYTLRQRCRMLYMSAPIATGALKRMRTNIVGPGLKLKPTIDREVLGMTEEQADAWEKRTLAEFNLWASRKQACDATGVNNFYGIQQLAMLSWVMSGDVFCLINFKEPTALMPYGLRLSLVEADRVRSPIIPSAAGAKGAKVIDSLLSNNTTVKLDNGNKVFDGVEVDSTGMIVAYHVANNYPFQTDGEETKFARVKAYGELTGLPNILQIMDAERPGQYRGVPYLAQAIEPLLQLRRYTEAELMAAMVQSFFTAFITTNAEANAMPWNEVGGEGYEEASRDPNEYEMGAGTVNILEPGEDVKFGTPTHPNTGFNVFMRALCEQLGAALEIPADLLLMSFNSSYSASRAALLEAWKGFRMRREWLVDDLCRPVYEIWLTEAVARGRIVAPGFLTDPLIRQAYLESQWIGPSQGQLDPTKEVQASVMAMENGLSTGEAEAVKLNGSNYRANVAKLAVEKELLRKANGGNAPAQAQTPPPNQDGEDNDEEKED